MLPFLILGLLTGLVWGIARTGPAGWLGAFAALVAFGNNPTDPLSPLFAFVAVFCAWRLAAAPRREASGRRQSRGSTSTSTLPRRSARPRCHSRQAPRIHDSDTTSATPPTSKRR